MRERLLEAGRGTPPLLLLHGFTGSAEAWRDLLPILGKRTRTLAIDLPGHGPAGGSGELPRSFSLDAGAAEVRRRLDALQLREVVLLGYSMGSRVATRLALDHPERVRGLVIESGSFGIRDPRSRAARLEADEALAGRLLRDGLPSFVDQWMDQPLFASQSSLPAPVLSAERAIRLSHRPEALAAALRGMGQGAAPPMWEELPGLRMPVLLLAGESDLKYQDAAREAASIIPASRVEIIPGAGHRTHLEQPSAFAAAVESFLMAIQGESR